MRNQTNERINIEVKKTKNNKNIGKRKFFQFLISLSFQISW